MIKQPAIYTVGYSIHEWADFLALLQGAKITAIADVRSHPTARLEQYRRENLAPELKDQGIEYVFLGHELGARREEPECYVDGSVDYGFVAKLPRFREGIERLERGAATHQIALMCAEREPLDCHRGLLIARVLKAEGWQVRHILADGTVEKHTDTEQRLVEMVGVDPLFDGELNEAERIERAYAERGRDRSYTP